MAFHAMDGVEASIRAIAERLGVSAKIVQQWDSQEPRPAQMRNVSLNIKEQRPPLKDFQEWVKRGVDRMGDEYVMVFDAVDIEIDVAGAQMSVQLESERDARLDAVTTEYKGATFKANDTALNRISNTHDMLAAMPEGTEVPWAAASGTVMLTLDDMKPLRLAQGVAYQAVWSWFAEQRVLIDSAIAGSDLDQLRAIKATWTPTTNEEMR